MMTPQEKITLEARLTVIEHLLAIQFASDFMASPGDAMERAKRFAESLRRTLEMPQVSDLPPELTSLASGELGDQADRMGKAIQAMIQRHKQSKS